MDEKVQEKKDRLLTALEKGMVMLHLDARRPGVNVPEALSEEAHLRLNLSYRFDPPDLSVGEWGVRSTLSFSGRRFTVAIPWNALFAITSHVTREFWMFPDDLPPELLQNPLGAQSRDEAPPPVTRTRPKLRDVSSDRPDDDTAEVDGPAQRELPRPAAKPQLHPRPEASSPTASRTRLEALSTPDVPSRPEPAQRDEEASAPSTPKGDGAGDGAPDFDAASTSDVPPADSTPRGPQDEPPRRGHLRIVK